MSLWRTTRNEVAGAWRSLRYDMGRRPEHADGHDSAPPPDVTSTGMSTFGGAPAADPRTADGYARPPRRMTAVAAFGTLAVVGAAGSYFAVVNGLGALLGERPANAEAYPLTVAAPPRDTADEADSTTGMGRGSAPRAAGAATVAVPSRTLAVPTTAPEPAQPTPRRTEPVRPAPTGEDCDCRTPPVPTPTAPPPPSATPSAGDQPEPDPSETSATPSDSPSAEPSGPEGSDGPARHPRAHR